MSNKISQGIQKQKNKNMAHAEEENNVTATVLKKQASDVLDKNFKPTVLNMLTEIKENTKD